ncbi:hypothetical protein ACHAWC_007051 [Mediolabrus comicus]
MPSLLSNLKSAREYLTPTLKSSAFLTRGVLTPEEFVKAGDELVYKCPTWTWEGGDPSKRKAHLPPDKQFLMTRNVPCTERVSSLENVVAVTASSGGGEGGVGDDDDDGDWLVSRVLSAQEKKKRDDQELEDEFDILDDEGEVVAEKKLAAMTLEGDDATGSAAADAEKNNSAAVAAATDDADDEYADMADFEDDDIMEDEAAVTSPTVGGLATDATTSNDDVLKTPRVWLMGYADDGSSRPLTGDEMMQDVISDYAHRTVTIENHPHVHGPHASIHPCQHGAVMKTIVRNLTKDNDDGGESSSGPSVEMYLFIFLKFVSSMIPTISYDFTVDVSASTKK